MAEFQEVIKQKNRMCHSIIDTNGKCCNKCPLHSFSRGGLCNVSLCMNPERAEKIIMKWAEEHPIKTNADKFKEVFGFKTFGCPFLNSTDECEAHDCSCKGCSKENWWEQEYKEVTDGK